MGLVVARDIIVHTPNKFSNKLQASMGVPENHSEEIIIIPIIS
jgi:hypothetical protein